MQLLNTGTTRNIRHGAWLFLAAALLGLLALAFGLSESSYGRFMPAVHGDWANHAATTRSVFLDENFESQTLKSTLNEFASYPKLTYIAAAGIANGFGISPLQGLSIVVQLSVILACLFFSLRLVTVVTRAKPGRASLLVLPLLALALFAGVHWLRIGFRDQVISNSFISQAASLALANIFLFAAIKLPNAKWLVGLMVAAAWTLVNTHLVGFTWCGLSMMLMAFGLPDTNAKTRIGTAAAGAAIFGLFLIMAPGLSEVLRLSGTGGDLRVYEGQNLSDLRWVFTLFIALYALIIVVIGAVLRRDKHAYHGLFWNAAGFLALGPLVLAAAVTVFSKGGNWYPVMKWVYVYFPELLVTLVFIASKKAAAPAAPAANAAYQPHPILALFLLVLLFAAQEPYLPAQIDLRPAILAEQDNPIPAGAGPRSYPGLHVDHPALNYFIARSVLKIPMDGDSHAWMGSGRIAGSDLGPTGFTSVAPTVRPAQAIHYRLGSAVAQLTLTNHWWPLELDHVWAANAPAQVFFVAATPPSTLRIDFVPFMPNGPGLRKFGLTVNGVAMPEMSAAAMDWSRPASHSFAIPPGVVKADGKVAIAFTWDEMVKGDLGLALVAIEYR
jgi:hypothetical protein